ncbi:hypothetical protein CRM22_000966 [Opisthorchis felineus]|uniref:Uncharacterized protein n=1 Tax=Opisthorchis felineus TaxID=147828 RepID=A0A4S2MH10_OPIFE|nr:hypothetical protein CRM22_000966 [Opisthorchis felineus]
MHSGGDCAYVEVELSCHDSQNGNASPLHSRVDSTLKRDFLTGKSRTQVYGKGSSEASERFLDSLNSGITQSSDITGRSEFGGDSNRFLTHTMKRRKTQNSKIHFSQTEATELTQTDSSDCPFNSHPTTVGIKPSLAEKLNVLGYIKSSLGDYTSSLVRESAVCRTVSLETSGELMKSLDRLQSEATRFRSRNGSLNEKVEGRAQVNKRLRAKIKALVTASQKLCTDVVSLQSLNDTAM